MIGGSDDKPTEADASFRLQTTPEHTAKQQIRPNHLTRIRSANRSAMGNGTRTAIFIRNQPEMTVIRIHRISTIYRTDTRKTWHPGSFVHVLTEKINNSP